MANETDGSAAENRAALAQRLAKLPAEKRKALHSLLESKSTGMKLIPRRDPAKRIPLTYNQQRLWIVEQFLTGATPYNQTNFIRLPFEVNVEIFRRALDEIVRRHEMLRSTILVVNDEPYQQVNPSSHLEVPVVDLRRRGAAVSEAEALELAADLGEVALVRQLGRPHRDRVQPQDAVPLGQHHHDVIVAGGIFGPVLREADDVLSFEHVKLGLAFHAKRGR